MRSLADLSIDHAVFVVAFPLLALAGGCSAATEQESAAADESSALTIPTCHTAKPPPTRLCAKAVCTDAGAWELEPTPGAPCPGPGGPGVCSAGPASRCEPLP